MYMLTVGFSMHNRLKYGIIKISFLVKNTNFVVCERAHLYINNKNFAMLGDIKKKYHILYHSYFGPQNRFEFNPNYFEAFAKKEKLF